MLKLYLTLEDDDGQKVERVLDHNGIQMVNDWWDFIEDMQDSLEQSKKPL